MMLTLIHRKEEVPGVESFIFKPVSPLVWKAGQYFHYVLHHRPTDDRGSDRWFTVASAPYEGTPMITTRLAAEKGSTFKKELSALTIGQTIEISELEGEFVIDDPAQEYVFIAGGIGITPFHSILKQAEHDGQKLSVTLLYANRDTNVPYQSELENFAKNNPNIKIVYITSPERIDENVINAQVPDLQKPLFYISGPEPMVKSLASVVERMGVKKEHIKLDDFPGYPEE